MRRRRVVLLAALVSVGVAVYLVTGPSTPRAHAADGKHATDHRSASQAGQALDPAAFSPGACEAFAPTVGNRHLTVFLDAGHGGVDAGGVGVTESGEMIDEAHETLPVELDAMALLRAQGFRVVVSRTTDTSVTKLTSADTDEGVLSLVGAHNDVAARDVCANDARAALLVGLYYDAGASADNAGSVTGYDPDRPFAAANLRLATLIQADVVASLDAQGWQIPDDGVLPDTGLGSYQSSSAASSVANGAASYNHLLLLGPAQPGFFTTPSLMPGALIEPLYLSDPFEGTVAASAAGQEAIAHGVAQAVEADLAPPPPATPTTSGSATSGSATSAKAKSAASKSANPKRK